MSLLHRVTRIERALPRPIVAPQVDLEPVYRRMAEIGLAYWDEAKGPNGGWSIVEEHRRWLLAGLKERVHGNRRCA